MKPSTIASLLSLSLLVAFANGCADDENSEAAASPEVGEDDFTQSQIPGVIAISLERGGETKTVGAKTKVAAAMRAMSTRIGGPTPRCSFGPSTKISFFDKDGKVIATGSVFCFLGSVTLPNGSTKRFQTRPGALDMFEEPLVPADALWGISKIDIERRAAVGSPAKTTAVTDKAAIGKVLDAFAIDQSIDTGYSGTRCPPSHVVTFRRGNADVALSSYVCGSDEAPATVKALFTIPRTTPGDGDPLIRGGIEVKAAEVEAIANGGASE